MLYFDKSLEEDLTSALQLYGRLQDEVAISPYETLEERMAYLSLYANYDYIDHTICVLGGDFAPMSFRFSMYALPFDKLQLDTRHRHTAAEVVDLIVKRNKYLSIFDVLKTLGYKYWMNGGLIYHGKHDGFGSGNAPTFSVCLTPTNGWSVHT